MHRAEQGEGRAGEGRCGLRKCSSFGATGSTSLKKTVLFSDCKFLQPHSKTKTKRQGGKTSMLILPLGPNDCEHVSKFLLSLFFPSTLVLHLFWFKIFDRIRCTPFAPCFLHLTPFEMLFFHLVSLKILGKRLF